MILQFRQKPQSLSKLRYCPASRNWPQCHSKPQPILICRLINNQRCDETKVQALRATDYSPYLYLFVALSNESYFWPRPKADAAVLYSTVFCSVEHRILADFQQKCNFFHTYPLTFHKCDTIYTSRDGKEQKHSHIHKFSCLTPSLCLYLAL